MSLDQLYEALSNRRYGRVVATGKTGFRSKPQPPIAKRRWGTRL